VSPRRSDHMIAWKVRLLDAVGNEPSTTRALVAKTAIPSKTALRLLHELAEDRMIICQTMKRDRPGGIAPLGWRRPRAP
jgi:hypothetical protein